MQIPKNMKDYLAPSKKSVADETYNPRKSFQETPVSTVGYTAGTNPTLTLPECQVLLDDGKDNPDCHAKRVAYNGENGIVEKYFIKFGLDGFSFDPWGPFTEGSANKYARINGRPAWNFREVNKRAFEFYKTYLQTRNKAWKNNAEREVTNG